MAVVLESLLATLRQLRGAARAQRKMSAQDKNKILLALAESLEKNQTEILAANALDLKNLAPTTLPSFRDRLLLDGSRILAMADSLRQVAQLADPVNEVIENKTLINGLKVRRVRSPLGVIFMIFESRPNVILEAFSLAFKSGNVILLRGGSESKLTAEVIYKMMREVFKDQGFSQIPFYGLENYDRALVDELLKQKDLIDIVVPRGGDRLIQYVQENALMPIIKNDRGMCHVYVDDEADLQMAAQIIRNAKVQRPGVCNSLETILVHAKVAEKFLPLVHKATAADQLQWHVDGASLAILKNEKTVTAAQEKDWDTEYLDLILNCKIVADMDQALAHIEKHGSKHSESIITSSEQKARRFQDDVDAAVVYWNASTRFTDGFQLGLGGELGISTQKLHVRGPVGLKELTIPRWIIDGTGQIRE